MNQKQVIMQEEQDAVNWEYCCQNKAEIFLDNRLRLVALLTRRDTSNCLRMCKNANVALALDISR